jgi:hypothetical protein
VMLLLMLGAVVWLLYKAFTRLLGPVRSTDSARGAPP